MLFLKTKTQLAEKRELGGSRLAVFGSARNQSSNRRGWRVASMWQTIPSVLPKVNSRHSQAECAGCGDGFC
jgi:hypothetical protein